MLVKPVPFSLHPVVGEHAVVFRGVILTLVGVGHGDVCVVAATRFSVNTGARAIVDFSCINDVPLNLIPVRRINLGQDGAEIEQDKGHQDDNSNADDAGGPDGDDARAWVLHRRPV